MKHVIFVGGVHGVGKSSMCASVAETMGAVHYTASTLIREAKHEALSSTTKRAQDVLGNQELLLKRFFELTSNFPESVLLDGHYTILNTHGEFIKLSPDLFASLGISCFICIQDEAGSIVERLKERDGNSHSIEEIDRHQHAELSHAAMVAQALGRVVHVVKAFDTDSLVSTIVECVTSTRSANRGGF